MKDCSFIGIKLQFKISLLKKKLKNVPLHNIISTENEFHDLIISSKATSV